MYSDGIIDQFGGEKGKKLKLKKLTNFFKSIATKTCSLQKQAVFSFLKNWTTASNNAYEQIDDIVVIGLKV